MLRINSLLYIEKLWSSPIIEEVVVEQVEREVVGEYGSIEPNQKDLQQTKETREESIVIDQETSEITVYEEVLDQEIIELDIPEQIDEVDEEEVEEEEQVVLEIIQEEAQDSKEEEVKEVEVKEVVEEEESKNEEKAEVKLKVDTKIESDTTALVESPTDEVHNLSSISSASSIPIVTPSSSQPTPVYSHVKPEVVVTPRQRKTSLLRRETDKFNDRRKSLTKKLRRALTVDLGKQ